MSDNDKQNKNGWGNKLITTFASLFDWKPVHDQTELKLSAETKDYLLNDNLGLSIYPSGDKPVLYSNEAVLFMMECAPVATAIKTHARAVASIPPKVWDNQEEKFVDHPVLELLAFPNADMTFNELMQSVVHWFDGTGNVYISAYGNVDSPPNEIRCLPSVTTTIIVGIDGYAESIYTRLLGIADVYYRTIVQNYGRNRFRFYANKFNEIYHIRTFNPQVSSNMAYGLSPLNAIFYEMRQYIDSAKFNLSVLNRAAKLSGVWKYAGALTDQKRQEYEMQFNAAFGGSNQAGRQAIVDKNWEYEDLMKSVRDMEYGATAKFTSEVIYKALEIPLPLINSDSMTFSNYESAHYAFFKNSVIPLRRKIDEELTNFLMPRYGDEEHRYVITFNDKDIPQLEPERNAQMNLKKTSGIYTINDMRTEAELAPIDGGQYIYGTMGATPIATDTNDEFAKEGASMYVQGTPQTNTPTGSNLESEQVGAENAVEDTADEEHVTRDGFIDKLRKQVNKDGSPRFTDEEIQELADEHFPEKPQPKKKPPEKASK